MSSNIIDINTPQKKIEHITWGKFAQDTRKLAQRIMIPKYNAILAIGRGGLIPATILSHETKIRSIECIQVISYKSDTTQEDQVTLASPFPIGKVGMRKDILVVDDLVDTGKTFKYIKKYLPYATYLCPYAKPKGVGEANDYIEMFEQDTWLDFPWE